MSIQRVRKFTELFELETFLNGGIIAGRADGAQNGGTPANVGQGIYGLVGKTLKFTSPSSTTVTFAAASGAGSSVDPAVPEAQRNPNPQVLLFKDIKLQVETAINTVKVTDRNGKLVFIEATPTNGVTIDKTGTANTLLGLPTNANVVGKLWAPPPSSTPPCWTFAYVDNNGMHVMYTLE